MVTIATVSDVHGLERQIHWPPADILVMAGDILPNFSRMEEVDAERQLQYLPSLNNFLRDLPYQEVVLVFGNHDWVAQIFPVLTKAAMPDIHILAHEAAEIMGLKFFGSPYQSWFWDWAFNFPQNDPGLDYPVARAAWAKIPDETEVLVVHGPPKGILDRVMGGSEVGCPMLRERIEQLKQLKLGVYGHIHPSYGMTKIGDTKHVNASACNESYQPVNRIQVINV